MSHPQNRRLLVIDDNHSIHNDFRKILKSEAPTHRGLDAAEASLFGNQTNPSKQPSFEIHSAYQGQEGLARVQQALKTGIPYAMAFIDVRMPPGWDGIETTAKIWEVDPDLQVVICTAYSDCSWGEMIAKVGQSDRLVILKKPFDNVEVLQLANALTEKWRLLQDSKCKVEDLERMVGARTAELLKSEERFRIIAENAADLIAVVDANGRSLYNSPSYERVFDLSIEELRKAPAFSRVHRDDQAKVLAAVQTAIQTGVGQVLEYRMQHQNGSWRVLESHGNPVRNASGAVENLVLVGRDITERRKGEEDRQQMEVQLRHAQKMESIGQLAASIAHEINTPTQYIGDNARFLKDAFTDLNQLLQRQAELLQAVKAKAVTDELVAEVEKAATTADMDYLVREIPNAIQQSLDGVERVAKIVGAMKEFSHPGSEEKTPLNLNRAIESTVAVSRNAWKYVANLLTDFDPNLPLILCLPGEFNQVVLNLIINAAHAIEDVVGDANETTGTISISTHDRGDYVEVRVTDTGTGIPEMVRDRIFDPFFTTKQLGKGTGQGLAMAHSVIADKLGGRIHFETEMGRGTTFIIQLPSSLKQVPSKGDKR